jgi:hypothetical protein
MSPSHPRFNPIACRSRCALTYRLRRQSQMDNNRAKRDRVSPRRHPSGRSSSTPRQQSMRRSVCASAHISSAKWTNLMRLASSTTQPLSTMTILPCFDEFAASADTCCGPSPISLTMCCSLGPMTFAPRSSASICRSTFRDWRSDTAPLAVKRCEADSRSSCRRIGGDPRSRFATSTLAPL